MAFLNSVTVQGNVTADAVIRGEGKALAFTVAHNVYYKDASGEQKTNTSFFDVVVFGENSVKYFADKIKKGIALIIEGKLKQESSESGDGKKFNNTYIVADNIQATTKFE